MTDAHAAAVLAIYQAGIDEGNATFETRAPDWAAFTAARLPGHRFVATAAGQCRGLGGRLGRVRPLRLRRGRRALRLRLPRRPQPGHRPCSSWRR